MNAHAWLEARFTDLRPRAIAALTRQFRDLDLAEEVFAASCLRALKSWPENGLPKDPLAWLLTVARNAGRDIIRARSRSAVIANQPAGSHVPEDDYIEHLDNDGLRDDVLRLLFICCHPALSQQDQSALALKIVTGMNVDQIARAFLVKPKTMEQRITRAKRAVAQAQIPFETPDLTERSRRLKAVSLMLYLLFNEGWSASSGEVQIKTPLCEEAIRLARLLLNLFPGMSELMGLLALFLFQHARRSSRLDPQGQLVPPDQQDQALWDQKLITEAQTLLAKALRHATPGSFQVQAAIAGVHCAAGSKTDWPEIERLYAALYLLEPSPVIRLNQAAAASKVRGPEAGLQMLQPLEDELDNYRWFHSARAAFHLEMRNYKCAKAAYERALALEPTKAEREFLNRKISECEKNF